MEGEKENVAGKVTHEEDDERGSDALQTQVSNTSEALIASTEEDGQAKEDGTNLPKSSLREDCSRDSSPKPSGENEGEPAGSEKQISSVQDAHEEQGEDKEFQSREASDKEVNLGLSNEDTRDDNNISEHENSEKPESAQSGASSGGKNNLDLASSSQDSERDEKQSTEPSVQPPGKQTKRQDAPTVDISDQCNDSEKQDETREPTEVNEVHESREAKESSAPGSPAKEEQASDAQQEMQVDPNSEIECKMLNVQEIAINPSGIEDSEKALSNSKPSGATHDVPSTRSAECSPPDAQSSSKNVDKDECASQEEAKDAVHDASEQTNVKRVSKDGSSSQEVNDSNTSHNALEGEHKKVESQEDHPMVETSEIQSESVSKDSVNPAETGSSVKQDQADTKFSITGSRENQSEIHARVAEESLTSFKDEKIDQDKERSADVGNLLCQDGVEPMQIDAAEKDQTKKDAHKQNMKEDESKEVAPNQSGGEKSEDKGEPMECEVTPNQLSDTVNTAGSSTESKVLQGLNDKGAKEDANSTQASESNSGSLQVGGDSDVKSDVAPEKKLPLSGVAGNSDSDKQLTKHPGSESVNVEATTSVSQPESSKSETYVNRKDTASPVSSVTSQVPSSVSPTVPQPPSLTQATVVPVSSSTPNSLQNATKQTLTPGSVPQIDIKKGMSQQQSSTSLVPNQTVSKAHLAAKLKNRPQQSFLQLGGLTVKRLGVIVWDRPAYHTKRFIFPVGFLSERSYASYRQPGQSTAYTCEILDGGERPNFRISVQDDSENPITAKSPTEAWKVVEQRVQAVPTSHSDQQRFAGSTRLCGAVYFGLAHPSVIRMLQGLPGASKCASFAFARKREQLHEVTEEENVIPSTESVSSRSSPALKESQTIIKAASQAEPVPTAEKKVEVERDDWIPLLQQELNDMKNRTRHTIQPLSYSQLQPEGWTAQEVDTFFNGLNEYQMSTSHLAAAIGTKTAQQVNDYASYVCDVMDRRVKASREEQLQKQAALLAAAHQSSNAQDAGAAALQAAVTAAASAPKEGTQLREMLKSQSSHAMLAQVLTHLWHTERLWRHALQQALQLFNETHVLSDKMMEKLLVLGARLKSGKGFSEASLKKRVEEETKRLKAESMEKQRKQVELEKQLKKAQLDQKKLRDDLSTSEENVASLNKNLRDFEGLRDQALAQMSECRGKLLKEQKARHALMLRKERLEAEVIRLRCTIEADGRSRRAQECKAEAQSSRMEELEEELRLERARREMLEKQVETLGHKPNYDELQVMGVGEKRRRLEEVQETGRGDRQSEPGRSDRFRLAKMASIAVPGWKKEQDGSWCEEKRRKTTQA